jgi:hypothetical protein
MTNYQVSCHSFLYEEVYAYLLLFCVVKFYSCIANVIRINNHVYFLKIPDDICKMKVATIAK